MRLKRRSYRAGRRVAVGVIVALVLGCVAAPAAWADPPDAPAQPTVASAPASVVVTFTAPNSNGSTISDYTATCTDGTNFFSDDGPASPITVTGLTNGTSYTCNVVANSDQGPSGASPDSDPVVPADVPDAPAQPTVVAGNALIMVSFTAPADNGSTITDYTATCTDGTNNFSNDGPSSPITVSGLTNGTSYTCTIYATNGAGNGTPSTPSVAAVPAAVPDSPAQPTVVAGNALITVSFTPPADNGSTITDYTATCTDGTNNFSNDGPSSPITVSGLTNGTSYTCTVYATNGAGNGTPSTPSVAVVPATNPGTPARPSVMRGNTLISVGFTPPAANGSAITSYTATCTDGTNVFSNSGPSSPITVSGLTNGTSYTCTVYATNGVGDGAASTPSVAAVPAAVPDIPARPTVVRGNARITVSFTPPANNGSPISQYTAACTSSNGGSPGTMHGSTSPLTVTALNNGKSYTCKVTATNAVGTSPQSPASATAIPATVPAAPTIGTAVSGNASLSVAFHANADNGSAITGFTATCTSGNGGAQKSGSGSSSPVVVTGLTNGKIYTCKALATNAVGSGPLSAASVAIIAGEPGAPTAVSPVPLTASSTTGSLKVAFSPGPANGRAITRFGVSCTSTNGGTAGSKSGSASPITLTGLTTAKKYSCTVTATNGFGTSVPSAAASVVVGAPAPPVVLRALPLAHGVAVEFTPPANNGSAITNYRARCTSSDGGISQSPLQPASPIVAANLTDGKTYTCTVTALNARGEGPPALTASVTAGRPVGDLAHCSGATGSMTATPGLSVRVQKQQTFGLAATYSTCSGPYVSAGKISISFRSSQAMTCPTAIGISSSGSGTLTWTSPLGMGKSAATIAFAFTSSSGHRTYLHYSGVVTPRANVFTGAHVSGNITLDRGLNTTAVGGDCNSTQPIALMHVLAMTLTLS